MGLFRFWTASLSASILVTAACGGRTTPPPDGTDPSGAPSLDSGLDAPAPVPDAQVPDAPAPVPDAQIPDAPAPVPDAADVGGCKDLIIDARPIKTDPGWSCELEIPFPQGVPPDLAFVTLEKRVGGAFEAVPLLTRCPAAPRGWVIVQDDWAFVCLGSCDESLPFETGSFRWVFHCNGATPISHPDPVALEEPSSKQ